MDQRLALLRGIVAAKKSPYDPETDTFTIQSKDRRLIYQTQGLLESLGVKPRAKKHKVPNSYGLYFRTWLDLGVPTTEKICRGLYTYRKITKIEEIEPIPCVHVDADGFFLANEGFIGLT